MLPLLASLALIASLAAPAMAQINPYAQTGNAGGDNDDDPLRAPSAVPGLAGYSRGLALTASIATRYEDNLVRLAVKDDGVRVRPQVSGNYGLGLGRGGLFVQGNYGRDVIYGSRRVASSERMMVGGGLDFNLSRCTGQVGGSWRRGLSFQTDVSQFGGFSVDTATAGVAAQCRLGGALSINGSVLRSDSTVGQNNAGPTTSAFNQQRWSYSAGIGFGNPTLGQFNLGGSISDSTMPGRQILTPDGFVEDGLNQRNLRLGYSRRFGSKVNVSAGVSLLDTQPSTTVNVIFVEGVPQLVDRPGFKGAGYDAAVDIAFSPRLNLGFTAGRNTSANGVFGAQFVISTFWAAQIDYRLGSRYTLSTGVNLRDSQFRGAFVSQLDQVRRQSDDFTRIYSQFSGRLGQRLRFSVDVAHNRRRANPSVLNFNSTGVGLSLGYQLGRN
ncbi:hypothetical protein [Sandarakinorhabdus sp.]|uniref:hypothetical protein n=1 Tax=Sandarakinorhabdus sp. TaxID=1916663 RepID=UPI00286E0E8A|nr:hypothetical protein [Sandarakinorhabdus sp.]